MLGETVRETRIRKGLTQARLARLAGVSRRHLAALEKGANVSILVLKKVAAVLELQEIQLGGLSLRAASEPSVNFPLLADTLREALAGATRAGTMLARAEGMLGGDANSTPAGAPDRPLVSLLPSPLVMPVEAGTAAVRDDGSWIEMKTAGELRHGSPIDESKSEVVVIPADAAEKGELLFRARGNEMTHVGIHDGDLLVAQLRQRGRAATAELVIARAGNNVYVGRWWTKNGRKGLVTEHRTPIEVGKRALKVVAVITTVLRQ
jgi:transcriptional regulator with XRE-family HTH domain